MTGCIPPSLQRFATYWDLPFCRDSAVESTLPAPDPALVRACAQDGAVTDPGDHPGLVDDCAVLLEARPILAPDDRLLNWSTDLPVDQWTGITVDGSPRRVTELWMPSDALGGQIPAGLARLSHLRDLWLSGNELTGEIPPELGQLWNLKELWLYDNELSGEIPAELAELSFVEDLRLGRNQLSGHIPAELGSMLTLETLDLGNNRLTGPIPTALGELTNLDYLKLNGNRLTGPIPAWLISKRGLVELNLRDNLLSGPLPPEAGIFRGGWGLWLGGNQLSGCLPIAAREAIADYAELGLAYCECTATLSGGDSPDLEVGDDGIPFMPHAATEVAGTYRVTFALVLDLPEGGTFSLGMKERNDDDRIIVRIVETRSLSTLVIDPLTGEELSRTVVEGPPDCDVSVGDLFDQIVASARVRPLDPPEGPDGTRSLYVLQPADGGRAYRLADSGYVVDVPEGMRVTLDGYSFICADPGGCYTTLRLRDEDSASWLIFDAATGEEFNRYVTEPGTDRGVGALFDHIAGSIQRDPTPSCDLAAAAPDCAVLLDIKATLAGDTELNWSTEVPLPQWEGVAVDRLTGRVVGLELRGDGASSQIPAALAQLSALEALDLSSMTGTIPPELGMLASLRVLDLQWNGLTGTIPPELGRLSNLQVLALASSNLVGEIPPQLGALSNLRELDLSWNDLTGAVPSELGQLSDLRKLDLSVTDVSGEFPTALLALSDLRELRLGGLTGEIPAELASLSNLQVLDLGGRVAGPIPPKLGSLTQLRVLYLGGRFTGGIPPELGALSNLEELILGYTLTGSIPPELGQLAGLRRLSLEGNRLTGAIPPELGGLWSLETLGLADNELTGEIPAELGRLWRLKFVWLRDNQLRGEIPSQWGALPDLLNIDLSGNRLEGCIPTRLDRFVHPTSDSNPDLMVCTSDP